MSAKEQQTTVTTELKSKEGEVDNSVNVEELLKKQKEELTNAFNEKLSALATQNEKLSEELTNLKTNTEEENRLLGQKIAKIDKKEEIKINPYDKKLRYEVYNEEAKATTICTGDEVECIVGMQEHITKKLQQGAKSFEKFPYKVKLLGK